MHIIGVQCCCRKTKLKKLPPTTTQKKKKNPFTGLYLSGPEHFSQATVLKKELGGIIYQQDRVK